MCTMYKDELKKVKLCKSFQYTVLAAGVRAASATSCCCLVTNVDHTLHLHSP